MSKDRYAVGCMNGPIVYGKDMCYIRLMSLKEAREACNNEPSEIGCIYKLVKVVEKKPDLRLATVNELVSELLIRRYDRHKLAQEKRDE